MKKLLLSLCLIGGLSLTAAALPTKEGALKQFQSGQFDKELLIIKVRDSVSLNLQNRNAFIDGAELPLPANTSLTHLFSGSAARYAAERAKFQGRGRTKAPAHLEKFMALEFKNQPTVREAEALLKDLYGNSAVEYAYFEPLAQNATFLNTSDRSEDKERKEREEKPVLKSSFEEKQFYLEAAPQGVDARYAWTLNGGTGKDVQVVDVEQGWQDDHQEFGKAFWNNGSNSKTNDHGTAVWGEVASKNDGIGTTGVAFDVAFGFAGAEWNGDWKKLHVSIGKAVDAAAAAMRAGDVLIIEQHAPGPDAGKMTAVEYYPAVFEAISAASAKGIIVVAAAGNGSSNFDVEAYEGAFDIEERDSGAILVGAAGSPGANHLKRLGFSNYGKRVDAFAYGENVTTTGYGDLFGKGAKDVAYTTRFSGTSSATPIVAGAVAALQGVAKAHGEALTPEEMRQALHLTGTAQQNKADENIGSLPNLRELHEWYLARHSK